MDEIERRETVKTRQLSFFFFNQMGQLVDYSKGLIKRPGSLFKNKKTFEWALV